LSEANPHPPRVCLPHPLACVICVWVKLKWTWPPSPPLICFIHTLRTLFPTRNDWNFWLFLFFFYYLLTKVGKRVLPPNRHMWATDFLRVSCGKSTSLASHRWPWKTNHRTTLSNSITKRIIKWQKKYLLGIIQREKLYGQKNIQKFHVYMCHEKKNLFCWKTFFCVIIHDIRFFFLLFRLISLFFFHNNQFGQTNFCFAFNYLFGNFHHFSSRSVDFQTSFAKELLVWKKAPGPSHVLTLVKHKGKSRTLFHKAK